MSKAAAKKKTPVAAQPSKTEPAALAPRSMSMVAHELLALLQAGMVWASSDDCRPHINCLHFAVSGKSARVTSTNGHGIWHCPRVPVDSTADFAFDLSLADCKSVCRLVPRRTPFVETAAIRVGTPSTVRVGRHTLELGPTDLGFDKMPHRKVIDGFKAGDPKAPWGVQASYLASVSRSLPGAKAGAKRGIGVRMGDTSLAMSRFDGYVGEHAAFVLLMPMRLGA